MRIDSQLIATAARHAARLMPPFVMPIYVYELCEGDCKVCGGCFEINRPVNREPLTHCPLCRKAVRKVITNVNTPRIAKPLSVSEAKNAGFSVWKKVGKGEYERE